jgi:hypothetical protein
MQTRRRGIGFLGPIVVAAALLLTGPPTLTDELREIGEEKQLFIDEDIVASMHRVEFTLNPARRAERVLSATDPWATAGVGDSFSVIKEGDLFKMWYGVWSYVEDIPGNWMSRLCYATSKDGIHWIKPSLGQFELNGSKDNNIIALGDRNYVVGASVFIDKYAKSPAERYKMIFGDFYRVLSRSHYPTISGAVSPDGIHWRSVDTPDGVIMPGDTDTVNVAFYDPNIRKYVAYVRSDCWQRDKDGKRIEGEPSRRVARSESDDFRKFPPVSRRWSDDWREFPGLNEILAGDENDPGGAWGSGIYNSAATIYPFAPGVYLFFPTLMEYDTGLCTIQFATSRDGVHIQRRFRQPYVPLNPNAKRLGKQIAYSAYMGPGITRVGDELWMYGQEDDSPHDDPWYGKRVSSGIHRYVQRLDGFVSLDARSKPGTVTTKVFVLRGRTLEVNADAALAPTESSRSSLSVEILSPEGKVLATTEPMFADGVALRPRWKERNDLGDLIGKPVQVRFTMRFAKLYAFQIVDGKETPSK